VDEPTPSPRVTRFEPVPGEPERVRVHLDDDSVLECAREAVAEAGLSTGDPVDPRLRAELGDADLRWRAREAALRLLSHRPRSRSELAGRLRRKDFPGRVVARCLDALEEKGLVDDAAFARAWARDRLRLKPRGRRALLAELRRKGVAAGVAEAAVAEVFEAEDVREDELVVEVALGWLRRQGPAVRSDLTAPRFSDERERARRRLAGYLGRRGFGGGPLHRGLEAVEDAVRSDDDASPSP
jgi:regulatory protein